MKRQTLIAIAAALLLGGSILAQQDQQQKPPATQDKPQMSMGDMMKGCREHCEQTSASIDRMVQTMDEAKESNDPAKMRAALDQAHKPLTEMKQHMSMCMNMMGMMQKMHGMGGMMGGGMGGMMSQERQPSGAVDITFTSQPDPPKSGENTFEVTVKGSDGKPVTDATVALNFYMAAMPSMNMPEMRNTVGLKHVSDGRYRGTGNVTMAGRWDVTVVVSKGGKEIGSRKVAVTAK